jgi:Flp pilus assembly pilin Flp
MLWRFINEEKAQAMTEYALATVLITLVALVFFKAIGRAYQSGFDSFLNMIILACIKPQ